jgi:hypothetical protein
MIAVLSLSINAFSQFSYFSEHEIKFLEKLIDDKIDILTKNYKKEKKSILKNRYEYLELKLSDSTFIKQEFFQNLIKKTVHNVCSSNNQISASDKTFLLNSSYEPNAGSYGFDLFQINLGLFAFLESEDELAFIICHEIAHQELNHFEKGVEEYARLSDLNDKLTKSRKRLVRSNRSDKMKILKKHIFQNQHLSKKHEIEADSLGMVYFRNTKYDQNAAVSALLKLELTNDQLFSEKVDWKNTFGINYDSLNNNTQLFNKRIIDKDFIIETDSIKSHPDIPLRISKISTTPANSRSNNSDFNELQLLSIHTFLEYAKQQHLVPLSLYINNHLSEKYPKNKLYIINIISLMDDVYMLKKTHQLGKHVRMTDYYSKEKNLNQIFNFLHELELYDIKKIKTHLLTKLQ